MRDVCGSCIPGVCQDKWFECRAFVRSDSAWSVAKTVWAFSKALARTIEERHPKLATAEYIIWRNDRGTSVCGLQSKCLGKDVGVGVLGSPDAGATVSTPVTWGMSWNGALPIEQFTLGLYRNVFVKLAICGNHCLHNVAE